MQLIKELLSSPTALIVLCSILVTGLSIIAVYSRKSYKATEARIVDLQGFRLPLVLESALSWEFEENYFPDPKPINDSGIHPDEWDNETEVSEGRVFQS